MRSDCETKSDSVRRDAPSARSRFATFAQAISSTKSANCFRTVDVNVQSFDNSEVLYAILQNFTPPDMQALLSLPDGVTEIPSQPGGLAIDYVREAISGAPMITRSQMALLPIAKAKHLHDQVVTVVNQAIEDDAGLVFAFGSSFADPGGDAGIHEIHMNQGNPLDNHGPDNGIWQDGALFVYLPSQTLWVGRLHRFSDSDLANGRSRESTESSAAPA
jgi:uncharacterized protein YukJ